MMRTERGSARVHTFRPSGHPRRRGRCLAISFQKAHLDLCVAGGPKPLLDGSQGEDAVFEQLNNLLEFMLAVSPQVSDLHFSVGRAPQVEVNGELRDVPIKGLGRLSPYQTEQIALQLMKSDKHHIRKLLKFGSVDLSYSITGKTRFRVNIFSQRGTYRGSPQKTDYKVR
jgi:hypothetical protein